MLGQLSKCLVNCHMGIRRVGMSFLGAPTNVAAASSRCRRAHSREGQDAGAHRRSEKVFLNEVISNSVSCQGSGLPARPARLQPPLVRRISPRPVDLSVGSITTRRTDKRSTPIGCPDDIGQICVASRGRRENQLFFRLFRSARTVSEQKPTGSIASRNNDRLIMSVQEDTNAAEYPAHLTPPRRGAPNGQCRSPATMKLLRRLGLTYVATES